MSTEVAQELFGPKAGFWEDRLEAIVQMMREMSLQTDPQAMVRAYGARIRKLWHIDRMVALSRRDLEFPNYRITRSSLWEREVNPWREKSKLPILQGGLLGEFIYGDEPRIFDDLEVSDDDPSAEYLRGMRSLIAIPNYDQGVAMNMTVLMREPPGAFDREVFPENVWMSNLFGRATYNLYLIEELSKAKQLVEREMQVVADIQRSLLPTKIPNIPGLDLAAHYQTSSWAGGDYYDFFPLPDGKWGILIADVSGHGTPAAVIMAITHSIAHSYPGLPTPPSDLLEHVNRQLATRYTVVNETFVTAFYGIYDPAKRELSYACAGHNPPRLKRCEDGTIASLDGVGNLPLGILADEKYRQATHVLRPGDQVIFYTDGILEAVNPSGAMFGLERLDQVLENCHLSADGLIHEVLEALERFTAGQPPGDDRTLLVAKVA
jgi:sigma-B regulation protein RsbU (phosphoserine phosphatase)